MKQLLNLSGRLLLQQVADEGLAYDGAAAFVTDDESERRNVFHDVLAVVVAGVRACAEYARYAGIVLQQRAASACEVAFHMTHSRRIVGVDGVSDDGFFLVVGASGSVKVNLDGLARGVELHVVANVACDVLLRLVVWVDAGADDVSSRSVARNRHPMSFS